MNSQQKNAACVNGTIEITLERIQHDIAMNSRRQNRREFALCVSRPLPSEIIRKRMMYLYKWSKNELTGKFKFLN